MYFFTTSYYGLTTEQRLFTIFFSYTCFWWGGMGVESLHVNPYFLNKFLKIGTLANILELLIAVFFVIGFNETSINYKK